MKTAASISPTDFMRLRGCDHRTVWSCAIRQGDHANPDVVSLGRATGIDWQTTIRQRLCQPPRDVLRRHRQSTPACLFAAEEIRSMRKDASPNLKAWLLLGINVAFIEQDISDLPLVAAGLESEFVDFPRQKTAVERRIPLCLPLAESASMRVTTTLSR